MSRSLEKEKRRKKQKTSNRQNVKPKESKDQKNRKYFLAGILSLLILALTFYSQSQESVFQPDGSISRNPAGGGKKEVSLVLNADGILEDYDFDLDISEASLSEPEARTLLEQAEHEIDSSFWSKGEGADHVSADVFPKEAYAGGLVHAEWMFDNYRYVSAEGVVTVTDSDGNSLLPEEGFPVRAEAALQCGAYKQSYSFFFSLYTPDRNKSEQLLLDIRTAIRRELEQEGQHSLVLPREVDGVRLEWKDKKSYLTIKVFFWLAAILVLLKVAEAEEEQNQKKKRREEISREYPEIVSKLSILMGAGMNLKQAWNQITNRYEHDKKGGICREKPAYEEMIVTGREIRDGKSERMAYQAFGERCQVSNFYRLSRILVRNLEKGNKDLCGVLQKEAEDAFETRKLWAKKLGEEAGTKMLVPLMLMMMIVIAIVIMPAFMGISF